MMTAEPRDPNKSVFHEGNSPDREVERQELSDSRKMSLDKLGILTRRINDDDPIDGESASDIKLKRQISRK